MNHTPTPWSVFAFCGCSWVHCQLPGKTERIPQREIALMKDKGDEGFANAAHIVKCVNAHDELVALLARAADCLHEYCSEVNGDMNDSLATEIEALLANLRETE